jgi:hypothetical protein
MAELSRLVHLLAQQRERLGLEARLQDLDCKLLARDLLIADQVHHSHAALAELALDAVAAPEQLASCEARCAATRLLRPGSTAPGALSVGAAGANAFVF